MMVFAVLAHDIENSELIGVFSTKAEAERISALVEKHLFDTGEVIAIELDALNTVAVTHRPNFVSAVEAR